MARAKRRERRTLPKAKDRQAAKQLKQVMAKHIDNQISVGTNPLPNSDKDRVAVSVQLRDVTVTEVGSICPTCGATINAVMPRPQVLLLKGGRSVDCGCGKCGQPMRLEYSDGMVRRLIVTADEHRAMLVRSG